MLYSLKTKVIFIKDFVLQIFYKYLYRYFPFLKVKKNIIKTNFDNDFVYSWRGLHLDVARHAVSLDYLYNLIDKLSENNLNRLHLHLSDDQGFRVEIKKYPRLHEFASKRKETVIGKNFPSPLFPFSKYKGDNKEYSFYYTQEELKALDIYARDKKVIIVPEIDIPGHATAILSAYREYSASGESVEVATYWGVFDNLISDTTLSIDFLKDIFEEISNIFSGDYIHIGGDEVPLKNYGGDISHYKNILTEVTLFLKSKNKKVIMWNEAFDIAIETDSILMAWLSVETGKRFIEKGGQAIFCPASHFYFDYYQSESKDEPLAIGGYLPIEKVYNFKLEEKLGYEFFNKNKDKILGIQANLWTEYLNTEEKVNYMLFPRFYALVEVVNRTNNNLNEFLENLKKKNRI